MAFAVARKVARAAVASFPNAEVEVALRDAMHQAIGEPRILLRTPPAIAEALAPRIADIAHEEGYDGRVQISPDPTLKGADCRVEWRGGGAERAEACDRCGTGRIDGAPFPRRGRVADDGGIDNGR